MGNEMNPLTFSFFCLPLKPTTLDGRVSNALAFLRAYSQLLDGWRVAIDDPDPGAVGPGSRGSEKAGGDLFDSLYAAWPTRFFVLDGRPSAGQPAGETGEKASTNAGLPREPDLPLVRLVWKAEPDGNREYSLGGLEAFLAAEEEAAARVQAPE